MPPKTATNTPSILVSVPQKCVVANKTLNKVNRSSIKGRDIGFNNCDKIFINKSSSKATYELFKEARKLKDRGFSFVWIHSDRVLIRNQESGKVTHLKGTEHLNRLLQLNA